MKRSRFSAALVAAVLAAASGGGEAFGQTPGSPETPHTDPARFLGSYLRLRIINENGDTAKPSSRIVRAVDVNGAVRVTFNASALAAYRPTIAPETGDTAGRRLTLALLDDLAQYGALASALARSVKQSPQTFDSVSARANDWYARYTEHVMAFFEHQIHMQQPDTVRDPRLRAAEVADTFMGRAQMGAFARYLQTELVRLLRDAERTEAGSFGQLSLVAWRITPRGDSIRVGLRGYDSTAAQGTTLISKITTVMTGEENASVAFHNDLASKIHNVRELFANAFQDYVALAADARRAATDVVDVFRLLQDSLRNTLRRPENLIGVFPDSAKAAARRVADDVRGLSDSLAAVVRPLQTLQQNLRSLGTGDRNPLAVLSTLSGSVDTIVALGPRISRLAGQTRTLTTDVRELSRKVTSVESLALPDTLLQVINAAAETYGRLVTIARRARQLIDPGSNVTGVVTAFDPEWIARLNLTPRGVATAPETEILITKAGGDRTDGDLLVFRADLLNPDNTAAGSYEWTFRLEKLGISSRFAAGVGFAGRIFAKQNADEALRPTPVLAWVLRQRTRGESGKGRLWNFLDPSPGVHVVTLSGDTQAVQFGVGLSLNLFQDFIQFGLGRKLQPENADDRWYWYFGLGLFKLARMGQ